MTTTTISTDTRAADIARGVEILNRLDKPALTIILNQTTLAYEVQESTKADMIRRLQGADQQQGS